MLLPSVRYSCLAHGKSIRGFAKDASGFSVVLSERFRDD
jgi:hypothetical protein